jgi:hypothetical protein
MNHYDAPWSKSLIVISSLSTALCVAVSFSLARIGQPWPALGPLAIVIGSALFTIRGYTVTSDAILVHRLLWTTRLSLAGFQSAKVDPRAMRQGIRTFGNGGIFSFTGFFRSRSLGNYRAYVTDPSRTVVLRYAKRTLVVSPAAPEDFVREITSLCHTAQ